MIKKICYGFLLVLPAAFTLFVVGCFQEPATFVVPPDFTGNSHVRFINADPSKSLLNFTFETNNFIKDTLPSAINLPFAKGTAFADVRAASNHVIDIRNGGDFTGQPIATVSTDISIGTNRTIVYFGGTTPTVIYNYPTPAAPPAKGTVKMRFLNAVADADPASGLDLLIGSPYTPSATVKTGVQYQQLTEEASVPLGSGFLRIFVNQNGQPKAQFFGFPVTEGTSYTVVAFGRLQNKTAQIAVFKDFSGLGAAGDLIAEFPRAEVRGIHAMVNGTLSDPARYNIDSLFFQFNNNVPYDATVRYGAASSYFPELARQYQNGKEVGLPFIANAYIPATKQSLVQPFGMKIDASTFKGNAFWSIILSGTLDATIKADSIRVDSIVIKDSLIISEPATKSRVRFVECMKKDTGGVNVAGVKFIVDGNASKPLSYRGQEVQELTGTLSGMTHTISVTYGNVEIVAPRQFTFQPGKLYYVIVSGVPFATGKRAPRISLIE